MLENKEIEINGKTFILYKIPAWTARKILLQLPSIIPKLGDYSVNEKITQEMLSYSAVPRETGEPLRLTTEALINNHTDIKTLLLLEKEMLGYNFDFFQSGSILNFLEGLRQKLPTLASKMLTECLEQLSRKEKQVSTN